MSLSQELEERVFEAEWDEEGVYFYQAYNDIIADWALENQRFGGPEFKPDRMTWIKPSFAWVLYRSGYGRKHNQTRILKIKLSHDTVSDLLSQCQCGHGGGGSKGRVQWDPARDLMTSDDRREPRRMMRRRAIQIGLKGSLSEQYVAATLRIEDVTELAHKVGEAHLSKQCSEAMAKLLPELPSERPYTLKCNDGVLYNLGLLTT